MTNVTKLKEPTVLDPQQLLQQAIASGASIETLDRLLTMQERWQSNQAKRSFSTAIAAFKANAPKVLKTVEVGFDSRRTGDRTSYKHEDLADLMAVVDPVLAQHGLWVRWKIATLENGKVRVTCVIGHNDGHSEADNFLEAAPDTSGNKNPVQAIGSTVSYLQRYTLKATLGLAAAKDDDGRASGAPAGGLSADQIAELQSRLDLLNDDGVEKFLQLADVLAVKDVPAIKFESAKARLDKWLKEGKYKEEKAT
jgi:hypothetical protein